MTRRRRLDAELVRRGLATDTAQAAKVVRTGLVTIAGVPATKASTLVGGDAAVRIMVPGPPFVSRGGTKLDAALERFAIDPAGLCCLDAGASTGGFTDRLLKAGAASVVAVDVGYGQLAWSLRTDPRVEVRDRTNVRDLRPGDLVPPPDLVVADLSFISLRTVLDPLVRVASSGATFVLLVKPQFEAGDNVGYGGVVRDPGVWRRVLEEILEVVAVRGLGPFGLMVSPVRGAAGNVEFLLACRAGDRGVEADVDAAVAAAQELP